MATYLHPGVYVEEIPSGVKPIEGVGTSTACFIGYTEKGPLRDPTYITSWDDYERTFGGIRDEEIPAGGDDPLGDPMGHAVFAFFRNGGGKAYVVRVASAPGQPDLELLAKSRGSIVDDDGNEIVAFTAINEGTWGDAIVVKIESQTGAAGRFVVKIGMVAPDDVFTAVESYRDISLDRSNREFIENVINDGPRLATVHVAEGHEAAAAAAMAGPRSVRLTGGGNGIQPATGEYDAVFALLAKQRDVNIVLLPGKYWAENGDGDPTIASALAHCEAMGNRMLIVDPPPAVPLATEEDARTLIAATSTYGAMYYPWLLVSNPHYDPDQNPGAATNVLVSPAAAAAGLWAKTDGRRGVWKAPAGIEFPLLGVTKLEFTVDDAVQDNLNPNGVNALRKMPGYGTVVWGTRTLSTKSNPEWRYVPVRRTAIFIEQSIYEGIQWAVFEPNDHRLWSSLRVNIESFMNGLFRVGAFQGEKSSDAYFVKCGLGQTMTQDDIDRGMVVVLVGFAPLKPAEFVIVRIQQKVAQQ